MDKLPFFQRMTNAILRRESRADKCIQDLIIEIEEGATDNILNTLLKLMGLMFLIDPEFRSNIKDFNARYVFTDKIGKAYTVAIFKNGKLYVRRHLIDSANFVLYYKDGRSLFKLLLSDTPDILQATLDQEVDFSGNINYINKFAYMAMHLKLKALRQLPA